MLSEIVAQYSNDAALTAGSAHTGSSGLLGRDFAKMTNDLIFDLPNTQDPAEFLNTYTDVDSSADNQIKFAHGTTTLGFKYDDGVVICTDSRASQGSVIASQSVKKVIEINPYLLGTMAGGAADCQFWERELGRRCRLYELRNKERISVAAASKLLGNMVYSYKGMGLSMGTMISGWDKMGPSLFYVDNDGTRLRGDLFSVGSGSTFAYGILDSAYDAGLQKNDAIELGRRAIYHAAHRDAFSGGSVRVYHINEDGWEFISLTDFDDLHWDYTDRANRAT
ncbi:Proteasome subunit beta type-5 [Dimargaris verticillata]|uniref:Proteasome subunit beta n=1 Tax=Dimargaris verticillata TaxID=2761393 RepID=A0A9W8BAA2_9FUNG|nr:Proteasome subunit beta type-5 [Dimargaris verticillata]